MTSVSSVLEFAIVVFVVWLSLRPMPTKLSQPWRSWTIVVVVVVAVVLVSLSVLTVRLKSWRPAAWSTSQVLISV